MKIALDYDNTYTSSPGFWDEVIEAAQAYGHEIAIVTARSEELDKIEDDDWFEIPILYCNGVAKKWKCHHHFGKDFDVWIDDRPESILENSKFTREQLEEWRKNGRT